MAFDFIRADVNEQKTKSRYRQLVCAQIESSVVNTVINDNMIVINDKSYLNFSSNDYLGLNNHPLINQALQEGADKFGTCASSSSLVTGYHYAHQSLEDEICQWLNKPKCLLFSSGFSANLAIFNALGKTAGSHFFLDKLSHASMIDGAYQSNATVKRFNHNNIDHLSNLLQRREQSPNKLIASEGVFSMDGCQANVNELAQLAKAKQAWLYLDDAHSIGIVGSEGQGSNSLANVDITMATFGKALATSGAFITCDENLHDYLVNFSRHYIYSTAISPAIAWATKASISLAQKEQWRREKISELSELFTRLLADNIELITTQSSIHAIIIGDEKKALAVSDLLKKQGIWLTAIRPPTVAVNSSRLRVTICANHNTKDIIYLAGCINKAIA
ncbi:8-amino-7-oxononanoate synthase [Colwellia sp. E2M01]|uniref:aminotransferase class I/II-fold pyridoxal phosphate-dependent enzyme n=1 Tax=Colwellia sp. E2M01 TaxID=2841561 RepID=UPI001C08B7AC|nr:8-amino-7-oxononanoate synthase [Colwellia sp. E2M01]MBU2870553.1 8-amino-7-oxononanoate synthase [Colwellia sp. E2M01]